MKITGQVFVRSLKWLGRVYRLGGGGVFVTETWEVGELTDFNFLNQNFSGAILSRWRKVDVIFHQPAV